MSKLDLNKIEREAPELLSLAKTSKLNLDKHKLSDHTARVALMLDISGSMQDLYDRNQVNELVKRAMPLALQFDDDGQIDVFCFNHQAYEVGEYGLRNYKNCVGDIKRKFGVQGGTSYEAALKLIDKKYKGTDLPVYVMFVTDGDTSDKGAVTRMMQKISSHPYFIQFMGLGRQYTPNKKDAGGVKSGFFSRLLNVFGDGPSDTGFDYLTNLDEMEGRVVDNANFFAIKHPTAVSDERLYELLMNEYPQWLDAARAAKILGK
jgi:hypothetical protein